MAGNLLGLIRLPLASHERRPLKRWGVFDAYVRKSHQEAEVDVRDERRTGTSVSTPSARFLRENE